MGYKHIKIPEHGSKITLKDGVLQVPDNPIIPYIEGDGIGIDITPAMIDVVDNAVETAYKGNILQMDMKKLKGNNPAHL